METMQDKAAELLQSNDLADSEKHIIRWQFGMLGDFQTALMSAICRADDNNMLCLSVGFPMQTQGYRQWTREGLGKKLRAMGLEI